MDGGDGTSKGSPKLVSHTSTSLLPRVEVFQISVTMSQKLSQEERATEKCHFLSLPREIRLQIYTFALPKPRILRIALDCETLQAQLLGPFSRIPLLLHICQDTRQFALDLFELGFCADPIQTSPYSTQDEDEDEDEHVEREDVMDDEEYEQHQVTMRKLREQRNQRVPQENSRNFYWNPILDTLYLISPNLYHQDNFPFLQDYALETAAFEDFLHLVELFPSAQKIAFKCTTASIRQHFDILPPFNSNHSQQFDPWFIRMLQQLPDLKSLDLLIEPNGRFLGQAPCSKYFALDSELKSPPTSIILAAPYDETKIQGFEMTAVEIEEAVWARMKNFDEKWETLDVFLSVVVVKKFKENGWCLHSEVDQKWWATKGPYIYAGSSHNALQVASAYAAME